MALETEACAAWMTDSTGMQVRRAWGIIGMAIEVEKTSLEGVLVIHSDLFRDNRGFFCELYSQRAFREVGLDAVFVQDNLSESVRGVLRGMHFQVLPEGMGKLVRCLRGEVFDVAVDLRRGSPTYGRWAGRELSEANGCALWIPVGFAHGFLSLSDRALVHYKCTNFYAPHAERTLSYRCPKVGIVWPEPPAVVSPKDAAAPGLDACDHNFTYPI